MPLDLDFVRSKFPSLESDWVFFDNGGGSQILEPVLDRISEYLLTSNVQHGSSYSVSQLASERLRIAQLAMATLINAEDPSEIVMGGSTTALLQMLARCFSGVLAPGDEVIVTNSDHESNIGPWLSLDRVGVKVKFWNVAPDNHGLRLEDLVSLMGPRTRLVSVTHTSNIFGTINPVREIATPCTSVVPCSALTASLLHRTERSTFVPRMRTSMFSVATRRSVRITLCFMVSCPI